MKKIYYFIILILTISAINIISEDKVDKDILRMLIFADPHYFDPSLGTESKIFQEDESKSIKLHKESQKIIEGLIEIINNNDSNIIIVPGDLSKDGEKKSNEIMSKYLAEIEKTGKRVFIIPGNHDINSNDSFSYSDVEGKLKTQNTSPEAFRRIFKNFGYEEALYLDSKSLSYIAALDEKTWLLAMSPLDSKNQIAGKFSFSTLSWMKSKLKEAVKKNINVLAMNHHSILEHYLYMDKIRKGRLIDDWKKVVSVVMKYDVKVVFTGHIHANDIVKYEKDKKYIFDIATSSPIIWPPSYRLINYDEKKQELLIKTKDIDYEFSKTSLQKYSYNFMKERFRYEAEKALIKIGVRGQSIDKILPLVVETYIAYYYGDESNNQENNFIKSISFLLNDEDEMVVFLANVLLGIWNDDTPDRDVKIDLNSGKLTNL